MLFDVLTTKLLPIVIISSRGSENGISRLSFCFSAIVNITPSILKSSDFQL